MSHFNENKAVAQLAETVALEYGIHPAIAKQVRTAALLHDIGKRKIPKSILLKPDKLTRQEFEVMRTHTSLGAELLAGIQGSLGEMARLIALYHHEWHDSTGSYWGKYASELPCYVQIVSISDVFVALAVKRPYKRAWKVSEILSYIQNQAGTQFSPMLTKVFLSLMQNSSLISTILKGEEAYEHNTDS